MIRWKQIIAVMLATGVLSPPAFAEGLRFSTEGTDLGRVGISAIQEGLTLTVELGNDAPQQVFVIARFQNNRPLMLAADGLWEPWSGVDAELVSAPAVIADGHLSVPVLAPGLSDLFTPTILTVGYRTPEGTRAGTIVVDGP